MGPTGSFWQRYRLLILWSGSILLLDLLTKWLIMRAFYLNESLSLIPGFFALTYVRNPGAAFGFLAGASPGLTGPLFILLSVLAAAAVVFYYRRTPIRDRLVRGSLAWILGGALGNLLDRLAYGEVIDFLDLHWGRLHWPAFNVADSAITLGVIGLLIGFRLGK